MAIDFSAFDEKVDLQEYNIKIDFGNETKIYTLQELIDMAEK